MRKIILLLVLVFAAESFAQLSPKREPIFHCMYEFEDTDIESIFVVKSKLGSNSFYEVQVNASINGERKTTYRKVNLVETYEGRVLTYGTGNFRVKINKVFPVEGKYRSFARIPEYGMHSEAWFCKDY
jgi:succinate dehydrogenase flavin-adding protein (antitoxin of CptAB toxin-antitoxin module)